ncbi:MAG: arylesterase [Bacteroidetes bacterium]|nr:MAG: arylesterase [Bacteroidota bacterium]
MLKHLFIKYSITNLFLVTGISFFWGCSTHQSNKTETSAVDTIKSNPPVAKSDSNSGPKKKLIVFFGNSLTAGYGLDDPGLAFPGLIKKKIDSLNLPYNVVNAGLSGETTAGGLARIDWILRDAPDIFFLELGGNDGLRGIPVTETSKNLQSIIDKVLAKNPKVKIVLAGMMVPPNMGSTYSNAFKSVFQELAKRNTTINLSFMPFLLAGVGGETALNQADGIHPNVAGHRIVAENVWKIIQPLLL